MDQVTGAGYEWHPITDLAEDWQDLRIPDLSSLARAWMDQHDQRKKSEAVEEFNEELRRERSIETGILERLYAIDKAQRSC